MKIGTIPPHWISEQQNIAAKTIITPFKSLPRFIAGADIAFSPNGTQAVAVAIVWDRTENLIIEKSISRRDVEYPYIPGFLSFREAPALLDAIAGLKQEWQVICFDGQGMAHPRGCGLGPARHRRQCAPAVPEPSQRAPGAGRPRSPRLPE